MNLGAARIWWYFLAFVMGLAVWLCASGAAPLGDLDGGLLERLAALQGLTPPTGADPMAGSLARWPGDLFAWLCAVTVLANLLGALVLYATGYWTWKNPLSPAFAVGITYFAEKTLWVATTSPADSLTHLALALALAAVLRGAVPLLALFIILIAFLNPGQAVMLLPLLAYLGFRRQSAYGVVIPAVALLGVGTLLIPLSGEYQLAPSLAGWSTLTLAPLLLPWLSRSVRLARGGIYLCLLLGSVLTGEAELASALAWADLFFLGCQGLQQSSPTDRLSGPRLRRDWLFTVAASFLLLAFILPGERHLNRRILIPAQKADIPFTELWRFFSLDRHARRAAQDPWRATHPFSDMTARDFELALELPEAARSQGVCPLTLGQLEEEREVGLLYALVSGCPLRGWDSPRALAGPLLLCKSREENLIREGPVLVLRRENSTEIAQPVDELAKVPAELDLRRIMILPYRVQPVSRKPGAGYRWISAAGEFEVVFHHTVAEVLLSAEPGEIRILSAHPSQAVRRLEVPALGVTLTALPQTSLPSRSLVPLKLRLKNTGEVAFSSQTLTRWRLEGAGDPTWDTFLQRPEKEFLLFPGESTDFELQLSTPPDEGLLWLSAWALTPDGREVSVQIEQEAALRTWRRTPPVGTWVEEP